MRTNFDAVVVGAGHNGLVAAALLARAGRSVLVLERRSVVGGAAISGEPFPVPGARLSRYSYLVSLFPASLFETLGLGVELRRRRVAAYTPGLGLEEDGGEALRTGLGPVAERIFPTLTEPLMDRAQFKRVVGDGQLWTALFERPLSELLERTFDSDLQRGVALTDATIGTFAAADDPLLRQNRCFLYHVIGNGTGRWDIPVGGMGAVSEALRDCAVRAGAEIRTDAEVVAVQTDRSVLSVRCGDGSEIGARHVLANVAPAVLARLVGETAPADVPEGSQLKINMLLRRLPRLRETSVRSEDAFTGTVHVNEGYEQLAQAYQEAASGRTPSVPPCELYCHSLTDPSILSPELRAAGAQTLTLFGLHMPARLFSTDLAAAKAQAVSATLRSVNSILAEPIEDCLWIAADGTPCLEALTPPELELELGMPGGHIFHRDLAWPFAESPEEVGRWGVETDHPNVWLCGAGARRGGGVSGIPGHNAAMAVLAAG